MAYESVFTGSSRLGTRHGGEVAGVWRRRKARFLTSRAGARRTRESAIGVSTWYCTNPRVKEQSCYWCVQLSLLLASEPLHTKYTRRAYATTTIIIRLSPTHRLIVYFLAEMPSLYSAGIRVRLGTLALEQTLTPKIVLKKGEVAAQQCEKAETQLRKSKFLDEEPVAFPGDDEGFAMTWLGETPFLQVVTEDAFGGGAHNEHVEMRGQGLLDGALAQGVPDGRSFGMSTRSGRTLSLISTPESWDNTPEPPDARQSFRSAARTNPHTPSTINPALLHLRPKTNPSTPDTEPIPRALVLHVMLTDKTFYKSIYDGTMQHIKIDVFFNGQLSSCVLVHQNDIRTGAKSMHQIFAGNRVDYMVERPWVIVPPDKNVDGTPRGAKESTGVQKRWQEICCSLQKEANARGVNASGERPPSAQYLSDLASMQMPFVVSGMQKPGGKAFGVVDVIVTVGMGKKVTNGVGYLKTPMRLVDEQYPYEFDEEADQGGEDREEQGIGEQERIHQSIDLGSNQEEGVREFREQDERLSDVDVEGEIDPGHATLITSTAVPTVHSHLAPITLQSFRGAVAGASIPQLSPSGANIYPAYPLLIPVADASSRRSSGSLPRKRGYTELTTSNTDDYTRAEEDMQARSAHKSFPSAHAPTIVPRSLNPPTRPGPEFSMNQYDGFTHADPYHLPYADMMVGLVSAFDGPVSSPLRDQASSQVTLSTLHQPSQHHMRSDDFSAFSPTSSPTMSGALPSQLRRVSFGLTNVASYDPGAPLSVTPTGLSISDRPSYGFVGSGYNSSPLMQRSIARQGSQPYFHQNPFTQQFGQRSTGPDPPIGFFTATTKPKSALPKDPGLVDGAQPRPSILVRRLVVTGKDRIAVVDHQWETPQRIVARRDRTRSLASSNSSGTSQRESPGASEYVKSSSKSRRKRGAVTTAATLLPTSPSKTTVSSTTTPGKSKTKRDSVHDAQVVQMSTESHHNPSKLGAKRRVEPSVWAKSSSAQGNRVSTRSTSTTDLVKATTTRHSSSKEILGIQGPKANMFVFDDPEELLRRKSLKSRSHSRSISPTKVDAPKSASVTDLLKNAEVTEALKVDMLEEFDIDGSSPLSSLPVTPEMCPSDRKQAIQDTKDITPLSLHPEVLATSAPSNSLPSMAGLSLSSLPLPPTKSDSPPPSAHAPTTKRSVISPPKSATRAIPLRPSTPASTQTPSPLKKRKGNTPKRQFGPRVRPPRSPDRVNTAGNPPLNQDCVIQLAQSKIGEESGPLRQIKCERQGVFAEESVVVGMRFFVAE
jgi:hypothetical protein